MRAIDCPTDIQTAVSHDAGQVAYLLAKKRPQGGYNFTYADLRVVKGLIARGVQMPFVWLAPDVDLPPRSVFNMACEDYVKRTIVEEFGVLSQVKIVNKTSKNNIQWLMSGVCPFHRIVHDHQNWGIIQGAEESCIICYRGREDGKPIRAFLYKLPLVCYGDGSSYPVEIAQYSSSSSSRK